MDKIPCECKQDTMGQWHYLKQELHALLPKIEFFIQMNFWTKYKFANCYELLL
jgi:hypothetical protein